MGDRDASWDPPAAETFDDALGGGASFGGSDVDFGAEVLGEAPARVKPRSESAATRRSEPQGEPFGLPRPQLPRRRPGATLLPLSVVLGGGGGAAWFVLVAGNPVLAAICGALGLALAALAWCWMR